MNTYHVNAATSSQDRAPTLSMVRAFAWGEVFVLIPIHAFWVMFRSTPFVAENETSALVAAVPFMVLAVAGALAQEDGVLGLASDVATAGRSAALSGESFTPGTTFRLLLKGALREYELASVEADAEGAFSLG